MILNIAPNDSHSHVMSVPLLLGKKKLYKIHASVCEQYVFETVTLLMYTVEMNHSKADGCFQ